jgi:hypothetical protein
VLEESPIGFVLEESHTSLVGKVSHQFSAWGKDPNSLVLEESPTSLVLEEGVPFVLEESPTSFSA